MRVTRRVSHVEQELLYLSGAHEFTPGFSEVRASSLIFSFLCNVLYFVVCPFLTIVLCPSSIDGFWLPLDWRVLITPRLTGSDYPIGIFKLSLQVDAICG
jgi:hypothetical protein